MISFEEYARLKARMENARADKLGITPEAVAAAHASKYRNEKTNGFDSKREYARWIVLEALERAGKIRNLRRQTSIVLQEGFKTADGRNLRPITYRPDFEYDTDDGHVIEDAKGYETPVFKLKEKMLLFKIASGEINARFVKT